MGDDLHRPLSNRGREHGGDFTESEESDAYARHWELPSRGLWREFCAANGGTWSYESWRSMLKHGAEIGVIGLGVPRHGRSKSPSVVHPAWNPPPIQQYLPKSILRVTVDAGFDEWEER